MQQRHPAAPRARKRLILDPEPVAKVDWFALRVLKDDESEARLVHHVRARVKVFAERRGGGFGIGACGHCDGRAHVFESRRREIQNQVHFVLNTLQLLAARVGRDAHLRKKRRGQSRRG